MSFNPCFVVFKKALKPIWLSVYKEVQFSVKAVPSPPKRPLTAYMLFCKENRAVILKENPDLKAPQQIKLLAEKWVKLSPSEKHPYQELARESVISYGQAHTEFYESLTEDQKEEISKMKAEKRESRKLLKLKKALKDSGLPNYPKSAYINFLQSHVQGKSVKSLSEVSKKVALLWHSLSDEEKQPFLDKAKQEKELYEIHMKNWKERLVTEGQTDLLKAYEELRTKGKARISDGSKQKSTSEKKDGSIRRNITRK